MDDRFPAPVPGDLASIWRYTVYYRANQTSH